MKFQHNIPTVGAVELVLDGNPARLYKIMEKIGEIERLNKLLHLGVIQNQFPGMRHTRLDYTMAMLYLIHRFREANLEGLSRESKVGSIRLSGRDILQILALISNIGHLPGTFAVEKGAMRFIAKNNLIENLKNDAGLNTDIPIDYLILNKVLALIKLRNGLSMRNLKEGRKF